MSLSLTDVRPSSTFAFVTFTTRSTSFRIRVEVSTQSTTGAKSVPFAFRSTVIGCAPLKQRGQESLQQPALLLALSIVVPACNIKQFNMQGQQEQEMGVGSMIREVQELAEKFKVEEDEQYISPYAHLEKATVLQEARYVMDEAAFVTCFVKLRKA